MQSRTCVKLARDVPSESNVGNRVENPVCGGRLDKMNKREKMKKKNNKKKRCRKRKKMASGVWNGGKKLYCNH